MSSMLVVQKRSGGQWNESHVRRHSVWVTPTQLLSEMVGATSTCKLCSVASSSCSICSASIVGACSPQRFCHEECGDVASEAFENNSIFSDCVTSSVPNSSVEAKDPVWDSVILLVSQSKPGPEEVEPSCVATLPGLDLPTPPTPNLPAEATPHIPSMKATGPAAKCRTRKLWTADEEARFTKALDKLAPVEESVIASDITSGRISVRLPSGVAELLAVIVGTRTTIQVRSHVQRYYLRKIREMGPGW
eukprot:CAMPEP_0173066238 /NCGR_PEP_ID=MMETSP1102-20130122/6084_1 /TAXON_ID=49646 /ORGANISM="Geminigera sp., Strain Caron Lab Isolate" /LENGTH=247 /DNA_ID=CAMNT_0013933641 /DNA_START=30 /DNA_END=770 /DNA_ORIENTATION=+